MGDVGDSLSLEDDGGGNNCCASLTVGQTETGLKDQRPSFYFQDFPVFARHARGSPVQAGAQRVRL